MVEITQRPAHEQRVIDEKKELDVKLTALGEFIDGDSAVFKSLDVMQRDRLRRQRVAMQTYSFILGERIGAF